MDDTRDVLTKTITNHFSLEELKSLCFDLGILYEDLPATGRVNKSRELILYLHRQGRVDELIEHLQNVRPNVLWPLTESDRRSETSPFKGLQYFSEADAELFFGREALVKRIAKEVRKKRFMAIVGPSGSGKSSIVRAGIVPALRREGNWLVYITTPTSQPLQALALTLTRDAESVTATTVLIDDMSLDDRSLDLYLRKLFQQPIRTISDLVNPEYQQYLTDLRVQLIKYLTLRDLKIICFQLEIGYELLSGDTLEGKSRELISYLERFQRLNNLIQYLNIQYPGYSWPTPPDRNLKSKPILIEPTRLLIVIDQFEELFTQCHDTKETTCAVHTTMNENL